MLYHLRTWESQTNSSGTIRAGVLERQKYARKNKKIHLNFFIRCKSDMNENNHGIINVFINLHQK